MWMRHVLTLAGLSLSLLAGCQNPPPAIPVPRTSVAPPAAPFKMEVGDITRRAAKEYSLCVWSNAENMRAGSPDARLVVDTAENSCKKGIQRLHLALAVDKTDPVFARSYVNTIVENARTEAMVRVLKGNAKDAKNMETTTQY
jgi:hypothetical protein